MLQIVLPNEKDSYKAGCEASKNFKILWRQIRIEHSPADYEQALGISKSYCAERKKLTTKNQSNVMVVAEQLVYAGELTIEDES